MHFDAEVYASAHLVLSQILAVTRFDVVGLAVYEEDEFLDVVRTNLLAIPWSMENTFLCLNMPVVGLFMMLLSAKDMNKAPS